MKGKENPKRYEFYSEGAIYRQQQVQDARWRLVTTRIKISLTTNLTLQVTPRSRRQLHKLKFYATVFLLMIKINQSTQEKSLRYYEKKKKIRTWVLILRVIAHQTNIWRMVCTHVLQMAAPFFFWTLVQWTFISGATSIYQPHWTWARLIGRAFGIKRRMPAFWFSIGSKSRLCTGPRMIPARKWSPECKWSLNWPAKDPRTGKGHLINGDQS